jgi:hypothetical protein
VSISFRLAAIRTSSVGDGRGLHHIAFVNASRRATPRPLPKYEQWGRYQEFLPGNIERFCFYWRNGWE